MIQWIGLTGGIGSGKSQVAAYFSELGVPIIDADAINRAIITQAEHPALIEIKQHFGAIALNSSGSLNREYMRQFIFQNPHQKHILETILHPHILRDIQEQQRSINHAPYGIIELPTLKPRSPFLSLISRILLVYSSEKQRIERIKKRNGFDETTIQNIIKNQISDQERFSIADDVLHNSGSLKMLKHHVQVQHQAYLKQYC